MDGSSQSQSHFFSLPSTVLHPCRLLWCELPCFGAISCKLPSFWHKILKAEEQNVTWLLKNTPKTILCAYVAKLHFKIYIELNQLFFLSEDSQTLLWADFKTVAIFFLRSTSANQKSQAAKITSEWEGTLCLHPAVLSPAQATRQG